MVTSAFGFGQTAGQALAKALLSDIGGGDPATSVTHFGIVESGKNIPERKKIIKFGDSFIRFKF